MKYGLMRKDWRARLKLVEVAVKAVAEAENAAAEYENGCSDEAEVEPVKIGLYRVEGMCSRMKTSEHSEPRRPCAKKTRSWQRRPD